jgi:molybdopterin molybdotransferase
MRVMGVPGNPVSSYVCMLLFVVPLIRALGGRKGVHHVRESAVLGRDIGANDRREDYLRARVEQHADGTLIVTPVNHQDSSLLANLSTAGALVIRPPFAPAARAGSRCDILRLPA